MSRYARACTPTGAAAAAVLLAALAAPAALAQKTDWPQRPVRFIVPFPPGGTVDPLARLAGARLNAALGQQFVIDNRTGGSGSIGTAIAAKSPPDGYTYVFVFDTHAVNPALQTLPYDTVKDFAPVMLVATAPMAIGTSPARPYRSFTDVIKAAKAKPDAVSLGSVGSGSLGHLALMLAQQAGGFRMVHVPYKGGGPMTVDVMGGHIETGIGSTGLMAPLINGGKLRGLAVTGNKRSQALPDVPALAEQGFPGFSAHAWWAIVTPAGIPRPIQERMHAELVKVFNQPDVRKQLTETMGMELVVSTPEALQKFVVTEMARWGKAVRENGIKPD